ncbi:hypothetical protein HPHPP11B_1333 [Helicobacter pylori Hp P-11b]|uniref:Uncharacterized protein n=1 Tax=Helicobacter pylori Hp P-11b TaxID=992106 RepID=I9Y888_HELPX|nr:hypothetical protein HPHPP11_0678 [Helicobacter pylori Hp P-11]EJC27237.1 hypothetical protein HPHPP11B_1333 [Helicobacter pylori Hp P-11b]
MFHYYYYPKIERSLKKWLNLERLLLLRFQLLRIFSKLYNKAFKLKRIAQ